MMGEIDQTSVISLPLSLRFILHIKTHAPLSLISGNSHSCGVFDGLSATQSLITAFLLICVCLLLFVLAYAFMHMSVCVLLCVSKHM